MKIAELTPEKLQTMNYENRILARYLSEHQGIANAISMEELARRAVLTERRLRRTIVELRQVHGLPIGSLPGIGGGYYWIVDENDLRRHCKHARGRTLTAMMNEGSVLGISLEELFAQILEEYDMATEAELKDLLPADMARHFKKSKTGAVAQVLRIKSVKKKIKKIARDMQVRLNEVMSSLGVEDDEEPADAVA